MLGIPFNIASYALLTVLIAKETGFTPGLVTGFLSDVHIYENHVEGAQTQLTRTPHPLPILEFTEFDSLFTWSFDQCKIIDYHPDDPINFPIAV